MERVRRKPFQGVLNIIKFNWHFYAISISIIVIVSILTLWLPSPWDWVADIGIFLFWSTIGLSLFASYYIYDQSNLYTLKWLNHSNIENAKTIVNINAGFDETSLLLAQKYPNAQLTVFDFYDPTKHTEVSIERARKAYPPYPGTKLITTNAVPLEPHSTDCILLILAAHEIRSNEERVLFFNQLRHALTEKGSIVVVEHLRDFNNFMVYNIGALHFLSKATWIETFTKANLTCESETKLTPFISIFIIKKNGNPS